MSTSATSEGHTIEARRDKMRDTLYDIANQRFYQLEAAIFETCIGVEDRMRALGWPADSARRAADQVHATLLNWTIEESIGDES